MARLDIKSAVLCDEVRREAQGTAVIVGASIKGPDVNEGGSTLDRLALYLEASFEETKKVEVRLWNSEHKTSILQTTFDFSDAPRPKAEDLEGGERFEISGVMVVNRIGVKVPGPGRYDLQFKFDEGKSWKTYRSYVFPSETSLEEQI